jgi:hypothetical protein
MHHAEDAEEQKEDADEGGIRVLSFFLRVTFTSVAVAHGIVRFGIMERPAVREVDATRRDVGG